MNSPNQSFCSFVDDVPEEASAIIERLRLSGFPMAIQTVFPARTTAAAYSLIKRARPSAAIIDFRLSATPNVDSECLGGRLMRAQIPTVFVTKDRNVIDEGPRGIAGFSIPIYHKQRLITESAYMQRCVKDLGLQIGSPAYQADYRVRLRELEEEDLLGKLTSTDQSELAALRARIKLEDIEELERIDKAQKSVEVTLTTMLDLIREVTRNLNSK